jgi:hypothetical protein
MRFLGRQVNCRLAHRTGTFTAQEVLDSLGAKGTLYKPATIRTHVTSRMCANAPNHLAVTYSDLVRVGEAICRLNRDR